MQSNSEKYFVRNILLSTLLFLLLTFLFLFVGQNGLFSKAKTPDTEIPTLANPPAKTVVVIDPGHGGYDSGTKSDNGILEKDLNLAISKKIAAHLSYFDIEVVMTRTDDTAPSGADGASRKQSEILSRAKIAKEEDAALLLSVHMNYFPQASCKGAQIFFSENNLQNQVFAHTLQESISALVQPENKRVAKSTDSIFLLNHLNMPAALLECGFLSNAEEASKLNDEEYQNQLAFAIASSIISYLYR